MSSSWNAVTKMHVAVPLVAPVGVPGARIGSGS